jgi:predicted deacylase
MTRRLSSFLFAVALLAPMAHAAAPAADPFATPAGTRASASIPITGPGDSATVLPVTVIRGAADGPTLALIAGTHGYEYPPITALQRLRTSLDPATLRGTVILVHVANVPSFLGRTIYVSPVDGQNLNRVYPGDPGGTLSERIAHRITTEVIDRADYLLDLHAGDGNEALRPYVYMPHTGDAAYDRAALGLARAFGLDTVVIDRVDVAELDPPALTDLTAVTRGVPAITTETGQLGGNEAHYVDLALRGIHSVLRHLDMIDGAPVRNDAIVWLDSYEVLRSPVDGVFSAAVEDGWTVAEGGLLGTVSDLFGEPVTEIRAPFAGVVNYVVGTPPVGEGDPVAMVSKPAEAPTE